MSTLAVRPALPQDEIFLYELYVALRGPLFAHAPITPAQREHLLRMQFRAQISSYTQQFPNSCYHVVLLDSKPVGRLWVAPGGDALLLVDIAIHPGVQSKGLGTVLVQRLQADAQQAKLPIRSTVDRFNPGSLRFHQRLGFRIVREDLMNFYMEWRPAPLV
ncbi:MAG: GNAT family N-acetyltransferase [Bryobacteraceae bacterium]|jgi:N-acetylglutamate synthase-like GNAT family acetyltransferase